MTELILGIESSCDETAAAVVRSGREVLSSVIHSQIEEHAVYGGVVPEIAGRSHLRKILPVVDAALEQSGVQLEDLDAIAVTQRPGLIGSLLVGLSVAKSLAFIHNKPLVPVHHIEAHVYAASMECTSSPYPCICLVVSGGHTALYRAESPLSMTQLATTLDDAAGEAFDKVSWLLGTGYPGGPAISKLAETGDRTAIRFPRYRAKDGRIGFSFSGLKTSVLYYLRGGDALARTPEPEQIPNREDVAACFQEAVVDSLASQCLRACEQENLPRLLVGGGVACNARLREVLSQRATGRGVQVTFPSPSYCTDNAVMIGALGWELLRAGQTASWDLDALPR
ncbi:MAG: N6-L-threonylcarbamoyladenine synthase [Candidatus Paceibacteria bacterium]|jgi:N6-L-threonylcarbamoyladenine synthase